MKRFLWIVGVSLLAGAFGLTLYNSCEGKHAEEVSKEIVKELKENLQEREETEGIYVGILEIPILDLQLPVRKEWNDSWLKDTPCVYRGSVSQNNMILAAHNYRKHFGQIKELPIGAEIIFIEVEGGEHRYTVARIEILDGSAVAEMTGGAWDLTLFTCTYDGQKRYTVRCQRVANLSN